MAKVWLLRANQKLSGIYFCIICGVSHGIQSLYFEILIKYFITTDKEFVENIEYGSVFFIVQKTLELACCAIAMIAIWPLLKEETKEIEWNSK
jgi:biotin transporter BioY